MNKEKFKFYKRIFIWMLCFSIVVQMGSFEVFAASNNQYDNSKEKDMDCLDVYDETSLLSACLVGGHLTIWGDITTESTINVNENVVIDLNGFKISAKVGIVVDSGKELVIKDTKYNENDDAISGELDVNDGIVANNAAIIIVNGVVNVQGEMGKQGIGSTSRGGAGGKGNNGGVGIGGTNTIITIYDGKINSIGGTGGTGGIPCEGYWSGYGVGGTGGEGGNGGIGIGGNLSQIYIYGGNVYAIGGVGGQGYDGARGDRGGAGGNGGYGGAGIECINGEVYIYNGVLNTKGNIGGNGGKGAWGGNSYYGKDGASCSKGGAGITTNNSIVNVHGGIVNAYGSEGSAAIGGSITNNNIDAGKIKIINGKVYVDGGEDAYDIGGAIEGKGGEVEVIGGEIEFCSDGSATNCLLPIFKNCKIYGVGAYQHEGIYNSNGKIDIELNSITIDKEDLHINDNVKISAVFKVNKTTGLSVVVPRGEIVVYIDEVEVGRTSLIEIESEDELVSANANYGWSSIEGNHIVNIKYMPGANDKYSYLEKNITKTISVSDHSGSGTCITKGICELCGEFYGGDKDKYHVGETHKENVKSPTCILTGYTGDVICNTCGGVVGNGVSIPIIEHEYLDEWESDSTSHWRQCKNNQCNSISATDTHEFGIWSGTVPTCENIGISTRTCLVCGYIEKKETESIGHDFSDEFVVDKEPTCSEVGSKSKHCSRCDDKKDVTTVPATGHQWKSVVITRIATCKNVGEKTYYCISDGCNASKTEEIPINLDEHSNTELIEKKEATCMEPGFTGGLYCKDCEKVISGEKTNALGHSMTEVISQKVEATCTDEGKNAVIGCSRCAYTEGGNVISSLGHDFEVDYTEDVAATCTKNGSKSRHCRKCEERKDVTVILALGHKWNKGSLEKEATCMKVGEKKYTCTVVGCQEIKIEEIKKEPNNHINTKVVTRDATCTESGEDSCVLCLDCGKKVEDGTIIEKKGHSGGIATCSSKKKCEKCGEYYGKIDSLNHLYKTITSKASTSKNGVIVKKCSECKTIASRTVISYPKTIRLSTAQVVYSGKTKKPSVIVKDANGKVIASSNYSVAYSSNKAIGAAKVVITFKGNYSGSVTKTFKIVPPSTKITSIKNTDSSVVVKWNKVASASGYKIYRSYNGGKMKCIATISNKATVSYKDKTATVNGAKYQYKVVALKKVKGKTYTNNYSPAKTIYFVSTPKITLSSNSGRGKIVVKWNKNSKDTGYQIQYSTSKKFVNVKSKTINDYKITKNTLNNLTTKKKYYVRVRTYKKVGKVKYYSGWSVIKYVKTK